MIVIENSCLRVSITPQGGCLADIYDKRLNKPLMFCGNPRYWNYSDHILFPFCGRMADGEYEFSGRRYKVDIHGFAKDSVFSVRQHLEDKAELCLISDAGTLAQFPFLFELGAVYSLHDSVLSVQYKVTNKGDGEMFFMIGSHPAFLIDEETEFVFPKKFSTVVLPLKGKFLSREKETLDILRLPLNKALFEKYNTLIMERPCPEYKICRKEYSLIFTGRSPLLALWSDACRDSYVCAESWWGVCDYADAPLRQLQNKQYVNRLAPHAEKTFGYTVGVDIN